MSMQHDQDTEILETCIDLLQAAWQIEDAEFERLLEVPPGWLRAWRAHEVEDAATVADGPVRRLLRLHRALRLVVQPAQYGEYIRRPWRAGSVIGERSVLDAVLEEGEPAIERIAQYLWAKAAGS